MSRTFVFYNPMLVATPKRQALLKRLEALLRDRFAACGQEMTVAPTLLAFSAGSQAAEAVEAGYDTFIVCGGDGTVFQVLQGIAGKGVALGVIPMGTGNVIAQNLGLPRDPERAAAMLLKAKPREVTLGRLTVHPVGHKRSRSWYFLIAAGMGLHAALMNLSQTGQGKRIGGRSAYFAGGARILLKDPIEEFDLEFTAVSGETRRYAVSEAIAVQLPHLNLWQPGGDLFAPHLRLAWIPRTGRAGFLMSVLKALSNKVPMEGPGNPMKIRPYYEDVTRMVCRPLEGADGRSRLLVEADGEVLGARYAEIGVARERVPLLFPE
uniref:DAGKc domain-containing protein n=1 Tax=Acidobacterium capsulatum TaxID=33075 RepID=A0A7V5CU75_9BACT